MRNSFLALVGVMLFGSSALGQTISLPQPAGTLKNVERITPEEKDDLQKAAAAVAKAQSDFEAAQARVAAAHKMTHESYMEWSSWYEFDGDYILQRFISYQTNHVTW